MPLLGKEPFVRTTLPDHVDDDDEVFFCKPTGEAFVSFDEFFERAILCSSMVWTCSVTGKTGLTFEEAVDSEERANNLLTSFPSGLQMPVLYLMNYINESKFGEIINMIYTFINDRYFIGEKIFASFGKNTQQKRTGLVLRVIPPEEVPSNGFRTVSFGLDPSLYKYEVEQLDDGNDIVIIGPERITRTKSLLTKDKIRFFLKHHLTAAKRFQPMTVKEESVSHFNLDNVKWTEIFAGPEPNFSQETCIVKTLNKDKKKIIMEQKREAKLKKKSKEKGKEKSKKKSKELTAEEKQKLREEMKQKRLEQKKIEKEKMKEQKRQIEEQMKEWSAKRDDLACDDLRPLPAPTPIDCDIPIELFRDATAILEFFYSFNDLIDIKEIFPVGITFDMLERILFDQDIHGLFGDVVKLLLENILIYQEEDDESTLNTEKDKDESSDDEMVDDKDDKDDNFIKTAFRNSSNMLNWLYQHIGISLSQINIDCYNLTEILRLYLLTSGAGTKPKTKSRGWFTWKEDPGLWFVINNGELLKKLDSVSVFELNPSDRIKLIQVLIDKMITFAPFRDYIDDIFEQIAVNKRQIRSLQASYSKWIKENAIRKPSMAKKEQSADQNEENDSMENIESTLEQFEEYKREKIRREEEVQRKCMEIRSEIRKLQARYCLKPLGVDRAFRKYWVFESLPGIFVEHDEHLPKVCLDEPTPVKSSKPLSFDELNSNFPKNESKKNSSPIRDDSSVNSDKENEILLSTDTHEFLEHLKINSKLTVFDRCTGNLSTCHVHGTFFSNEKVKWAFYHTKEQIDVLLKCLNTRGYRESELQSVISQDKPVLCDILTNCQAHKLNKNIPPPDVRKSQRLQDQCYTKTSSSQPKMQPNEAFLSYMRVFLLEMEEKIFAGGLGQVKFSAGDSRENWRNTVLSYEDEDDKVIAVLSNATLQLAQGVKSQYLTLPFSAENGSFERWSESIRECSSYSQLFVHLNVFDQSVVWSKSALKAYCKICRRKGDAENMLLCDECNRGHHTYCLKPKLDSIPHGEWFCPKCKPKVRVMTPKKQRKQVDSDNEADSLSEDDDDTSTNSSYHSKVENNDRHKCFACHKTNADLKCKVCKKFYHLSCVNLKKKVNGVWTCKECEANLTGKRQMRKRTNVSGFYEEREQAEAKKQKRSSRYSMDYDYVNGQLLSDEDGKKSKEGKKAVSFEDAQQVLPLDFKMCEEILKKLQKHSESWPFYKVPSKKYAPNYKSVVKRHIDFGLLVSKLNMGKYRLTIEFFNDILLMLENCKLYWPFVSAEYRAGQSVANYFDKLIKEYGFKF